VGRNSEIVDGMLKIDHLQFDGNLSLQFNRVLISLPDGLSVTGWMDLSCCTALTALPDSLVVDDWLDLQRCTALASLPDDMVIGETLYLQGCTALTELPKGLVVKRSINLEGCTAIKALPADMQVGYAVILDGMTIYRDDQVVLDGVTLPMTAHEQCPGRRLGDVVDHWALRWKGLQDRIIEHVEINFEGDLSFDLKPAS